MADPLLSVRGLQVHLGGDRSRLGRSRGRRILDNVRLDVHSGEIVGIIGETGSGKTTLARTIVGLVTPTAGEIRFEGRDISHLTGGELRRLRRSGALQLVLQDPLRSLDPDLTVEQIVGEGLAVRGDEEPARRQRVVEALELVRLGPDVLSRKPGQISGGQRQRVSVARSLVLEPRLLLCDEPVSALDAPTRHHVLGVLRDLRRRLGVAIVVISHDLASLAGSADRIAVLYGGTIVEDGPLPQIFEEPRHPYTALVVASAPRLVTGGTTERLPAALLRGPRPAAGPPQSDLGCVYRQRCPFATPECAAAPDLGSGSGPWEVACHHADDWRGDAEKRLDGDLDRAAAAG